MATYLITGASRGLGFEFVRQLSNEPANTIVGLVRDKTTTVKKISDELPDRKNVHIVQGDLTDYASLKKAVEEIAKISSGVLDYVIGNAGYAAPQTAFDPIGVLGENPEAFEEELIYSLKSNTIGHIHLFNLCLPLILKGQTKKVIAISTGHADLDIVSRYDIDGVSSYAISKAALNMAVAKFSAQYAKDGVLFLSVAPGYISTDMNVNIPPEQVSAAMAQGAKFQQYAPHFTGATTPEVAVGQVLAVVERMSIKTGDAGTFVSQFGNKQWL